MIRQLEGMIAYRERGRLLLSVGGVGYDVRVGESTLERAGSAGNKLVIWTHLAIREQSHDLYGFIDKLELDFFELLISVPGIGPKSALSVLDLAPIETLAHAIRTGDTLYLTKVSGIGRKTAQKIVLELRDKIGSTDLGAGVLKDEVDALEALRSLGYSTSEARDALNDIGPNISGTSDRVKAALKVLSGS